MLEFTFEQVELFGVIVAIFWIAYYILLNKKGVNKRNNKYNKFV